MTASLAATRFARRLNAQARQAVKSAGMRGQSARNAKRELVQSALRHIVAKVNGGPSV